MSRFAQPTLHTYTPSLYNHPAENSQATELTQNIICMFSSSGEMWILPALWLDSVYTTRRGSRGFYPRGTHGSTGITFSPESGSAIPKHVSIFSCIFSSLHVHMARLIPVLHFRPGKRMSRSASVLHLLSPCVQHYPRVSECVCFGIVASFHPPPASATPPVLHAE